MIFFFIFLYGLILSAGDLLAPLNPLFPLITSLGVLVYCRLMLEWVKRTGQTAEIGLVLPHIKGTADIMVLLPLLVPPVLNAALFGYSLLPLSAVLLAFGVAVAEEVFFRGFLLRFLARLGDVAAPLVGSLFFGLFHFINVFGGADPLYTALQAFFAFGTGLAFCGTRRSSGSLLPCIIAHFLINLTGAESVLPQASAVWALSLCGGLMAVWGLWLWTKKH